MKKEITPKRMSMHHRQPCSHGGKGNPENISKVSMLEHRAWHQLFSNLTPYGIVEIINRIWLDPRYHIEVYKKKGGKYDSNH